MRQQNTLTSMATSRPDNFIPARAGSTLQAVYRSIRTAALILLDEQDHLIVLATALGIITPAPGIAAKSPLTVRSAVFGMAVSIRSIFACSAT